MEAGHLICSKAKCKAVLPPEIPGQKYFKTCEKCRRADALQKKRKRQEEKENSGPAPPPPPSLQSERTPLATVTENNPGLRDDMPPEETDKEEEIGLVSLISIPNH
jgi:hypothetical protein